MKLQIILWINLPHILYITKKVYLYSLQLKVNSFLTNSPKPKYIYQFYYNMR